MTPDELMAEACRLGKESVDNGWGGPFGAVIVTKPYDERSIRIEQFRPELANPASAAWESRVNKHPY